MFIVHVQVLPSIHRYLGVTFCSFSVTNKTAAEFNFLGKGGWTRATSELIG